MAKPDPTKSDFLAVISEWSSQTRNGGLVGNAYPILNLTEEVPVAQPESDFANAGAVFLINRGNLNTWDYVRLRPRQNETYKNAGERDCFYIPAGFPALLAHPDDLTTAAAVLPHPTFDPTGPTRQLLNPVYNVTPVFFVKKGENYFGPLVRENFHRSQSDDIQRIDWRAADDDGIVYEFTAGQIAAANLRLARYEHPTPFRNRILGAAITLLVGKVRDAKSPKAHDTLPTAAVLEWYARRCPPDLIPPAAAAALREGFKTEATDSPAIVTARLRRVDAAMATHALFAEQRERFARDFLATPAGQQRLQETIDVAVKKKAAELQQVVDEQDKQLAERRNALAEERQRIESEHERRIGEMAAERSAAAAAVDDLRAAEADLKASLGQDAAALAAKMREQLPLIAALAGSGRDAGGVVVTAAASPAAAPAPKFDSRPVPPTKPTPPATDEAKVVDDLRADLARQGLHYARDFVANVYACLKAEPLNLIIGPPGYGKSMLVTALARSLGHADAFLPVTVRRSWAEDRHLLGFYDTFNNRYDPGPTRLVPRMIQAEADWRGEKRGAYIVLLDEFNLAAPEYYFAQLLQTLHADGDRAVALYDPESFPGERFPSKVALGPNLRFWGTINYDETTERLSPRTLDRTGMVFLNDADVRPAADGDAKPTPGVAASDLFGKFLRTHAQCPDDRWEMVARVIDELRSVDVGIGPKVELSPRVKQGIRRYLANTPGVLEAKAAVDFVVQQRVLPVVRGRGDEFTARVRRLLDVLGRMSLDRSARHVEDTLGRSDNQFGDVDFLSY